MKNLGMEVPPAGRTVWWWLALGAVLLGAGLRLWQWSLGATFFMDELAIIHNLVTRTPGQLVGVPLAEAQVAPPLFLLVEKACLTLLGPSEWSLRLPALLASVVALPLLWAVARRVLAAPVVPLAVLTLAVGFTFIYYGTQVKQYASDVAGGLLITWLALRLREAPAPPRRFWVAVGLVGVVLPFYSQAALMGLAGCGGALLLLAFLDPGRPRLRATLAVVAAWAGGCGGSLALALAALSPLDRGYMHFFWREGLLPLNTHLPAVLVGEMTERWANGLGWPHPTSLWVLVSAMGLGVLWRRHREAALLLLAPWLMSAAASLAQQFPVRLRLMDFLMPPLVLFVFAALQEAARWAGRRRPRLGGGVLALGVLPPLYGITRHNLPPYAAEDAKPLYAQLARVRRPTEAVYAYYGVGQSLRWYGARYGLPPGSYTLGHCYRIRPGAERAYLTEIDAFRGRRVWLLMGHFGEDEAGPLTAYLDSIGRRGARLESRRKLPDELKEFPLMYAQLYDLTDPSRAARYAAATFPLPPPLPHTPGDVCWSCYGPQVLPASLPPNDPTAPGAVAPAKPTPTAAALATGAKWRPQLGL